MKNCLPVACLRISNFEKPKQQKTPTYNMNETVPYLIPTVPFNYSTIHYPEANKCMHAIHSLETILRHGYIFSCLRVFRQNQNTIIINYL